MPNHIFNQLTIITDSDTLKSVLHEFGTYHPEKHFRTSSNKLAYIRDKGELPSGWFDEETQTFELRDGTTYDHIPKEFEPYMESAWFQFPDFNKVERMPKELDITYGSWGELGEAILTKSGTQFKSFGEAAKEYNSLSDKDQLEVLELGAKYISNLENYGHRTWYTWCVENWGTKWNSYSCERDDNIFIWNTAWSNVLNLVVKISNVFPDVEFGYEYSDEDMGSNCGTYVVYGGSVAGVKLTDGSIEAYELAFYHRPECREDYKLVDGNYEYIDE